MRNHPKADSYGIGMPGPKLHIAEAAEATPLRRMEPRRKAPTGMCQYARESRTASLWSVLRSGSAAMGHPLRARMQPKYYSVWRVLWGRSVNAKLLICLANPAAFTDVRLDKCGRRPPCPPFRLRDGNAPPIKDISVQIDAARQSA